MSEHQSRRRAWAYLSRVSEAPSPQLHALIARDGPEAAANAVRQRAVPAALAASTQARHHLDSAAADLDHIQTLGGRLVTPGGRGMAGVADGGLHR